MKTSEYIKAFNLDKDNKFSREGFLAAFTEEFHERVEHHKVIAIKTKTEFSYNKFTQVVKEQYQKFQSISNKKSGLPLTENLWGVFYATVVVKVREVEFPEEHAEIMSKRQEKEDRMKEQEDTMKL